MLAVVKANAYGHGLVRAARALAAADGFGLIELDSAVRLREAGYRQPIVLLEGCFEAAELPVLAQHGIATVVHSREQIEMLTELPGGAALDVFVKVNTGMNRLGFEPGAIPGAVAATETAARGEELTLMTHFASADEARGVALADGGARAGCGRARPCRAASRIRRRSCAIPATHADWVRPGIMLYGCSPFAECTAADLDLKPVMTLESRVIAIQSMKRGDIAGLRRLFTAERDTRVGVVACGYADGYPRHAPTGTPIMVEGRMTRTLGRVSMDMLCADLSGHPGGGPGLAGRAVGRGRAGGARRRGGRHRRLSVAMRACAARSDRGKITRPRPKTRPAGCIIMCIGHRGRRRNMRNKSTSARVCRRCRRGRRRVRLALRSLRHAR